jgi:hypothetical protein
MFAGRPRDFGRRVQAPITADVERQLKQLVAKFGAKKVREALDPLIDEMQMERLATRSERDRSNSSSEMSSNPLYRRHATLARPYASNP